MILPITLAATLISQEAPPCPIRVTRVSSYGLSIRVWARNRADYPLDHIVVYVTFDDGLLQAHEKRYPVNGIVQPNQTLTFTTPPITDAVVRFDTADASFTCRELTD